MGQRCGAGGEALQESGDLGGASPDEGALGSIGRAERIDEADHLWGRAGALDQHVVQVVAQRTPGTDPASIELAFVAVPAVVAAPATSVRAGCLLEADAVDRPGYSIKS